MLLVLSYTCLIFCLLLGLARPVTAATLPIADIAAGKVISINGQQFVKIGSDVTKGAQFMALKKAILPGFADGMAMADFTAAMCNEAPTPVATEYFWVGNLVDSRDGKSYEVRKFADGKCWMVDNLMYGGPSDNCTGVDATGYTDATYGGAVGMAAPSNRFGAGTYGNCRDPRVGCIVGADNNRNCLCSSGSTICGYLYNWQAVMQHSSAYHNATYTGPAINVQGICPLGWHLPTDAGDAGEFKVLHVAAGLPESGFWQEGSWKGAFSGDCDSSGNLHYQGSDGGYWSSEEYGTYSAHNLLFYGTSVNPKSSGQRNRGLAVRCIKDGCQPNYLSSDSACVTAETVIPGCVATDGYVCTGCASGYVLRNGVCAVVPNCTTYNSTGCTACTEGYSLSRDGTACVVSSGTMQSWNGCAALATPTRMGFTQGPYLTDSRDGKVYEVRKFADGECWMVDNLAYGGGSDGVADYCAGKTTFRNARSAADTVAIATNGLNPPDGSRNTLVGDCQDAAAGAKGPFSPCYDSTVCGYLYNWASATQDANGWRGNAFQPTEPTRGICPVGWHLPSGGSSGEFRDLHVAAGRPLIGGFWQPGGSWKGVFSGSYINSTSLYGQGVDGYYWSSTQYNANLAYELFVYDDDLYPGRYENNKLYGNAVRCIKN